MEDNKYNIGEFIERRIRATARPIAEAAADAMHDKLAAEIQALGLDYFASPVVRFAREIRDAYLEKLVQDRLTGVVDGLINGSTVAAEAEHEHATIATVSGDTVVISHPSALTTDQRGQIASRARESLPHGVNVLVLDGGMTVAAVVKA